MKMALDWDIREISKLIKKAQSGDEDAIVELLDHYEYQINNIADFFMDNYDVGILDKDDLMQAGRIGILNCLNRPTDVRFASKINRYIWQSIQREIYNNCRTIRLPVHIWEEYNNAKDDPNPPVLDTFIKNETEPLDNYDFVWTDFENERLTDYNYEHLITKLINVCSPKEQFVLYQRIWREKTLEETGRRLGVTRERVRQIENRALHKITSVYRHADSGFFDVVYEKTFRNSKKKVRVITKPLF